MKTIGRSDQGDYIVELSENEFDAFQILARRLGGHENFRGGFEMDTFKVTGALSAIIAFANTAGGLYHYSDQLKGIADSLSGKTE